MDNFSTSKEDLSLWNVIFLILLIESMKKPNIQMTHIFHLFQVATDCGLAGVEVMY